MSRDTLTRRQTLLAALVGTGTLTLAGCGSSEPTAETTGTEGAIVIDSAWVRATSDDMTGVFVNLSNTTDQDITLEAAASSIAASVELHETVTEGGTETMKAVEGGILIPANGSVSLMPGGAHIMLMGLTQDIKPGDPVSITLEFSGDTDEITLSVPAREAAAGGENYGASDGGGAQDGAGQGVGASDAGGQG